MKIGISVPPEVGVPLDVAALAQRAEELGLESIWLGEHPIMPVVTASPYPNSPDGVIPESYAYFPDPFVQLARASAVTTRLRLATSICLVPERNPLLLAKKIATLDYFSGGRFIFGIGAGWLKEETEIMGGDFPHRWSQVREAVLAMKEIWTKDEAEFHGRYYDFPLVRSYPKPAQKPHPPVLLGGSAKNVFSRVVAWGDGWMPTRMAPEEIGPARAKLDEMATIAGRDPRSIEITVTGQPSGRGLDRELMSRFEEAGADRVVVRLVDRPGEQFMARLEEVADQLQTAGR